MKHLATYPRTVWRNKRSHIDLPRMLTYTATLRCNARCIMCDSWKIDAQNELSLPELATIFDQLPSMDIVRITGGEPFLRQDLPEIVHQVQEKLKPVMVHITTNGFLTDRIVEFCESRDKKTPLFILLSVDGMKERHDYIRGTKNAWDRVMQTIQALYPKRRKNRLKIAINQTIIDAKGIEEYTELQDYLAPYDLQINGVMAYQKSAIYNRQQYANLAPSDYGQFETFGEFRPDQIDTLFRVFSQGLNRYPYFNRLAKRYYLRGIHDRLMNGKSNLSPKCVALNSHMRILPDGRIPICQFNTDIVGNLRLQDFEEIWFSAGINEHRRWVRNCPGCWAECEVLPNAVYTGDIFRHIF